MLHRLMIDQTGPEPVHVFLRDLSYTYGPLVLLYPLRAPTAGAVLGRAAVSPYTYQVFGSEAQLLAAGLEPAGWYRVCDSWDDHRPPSPCPSPASPRNS